MEIIAHRGLWRERGERNTWTALSRAKESGFGTETDFRDYRGALAVSHDIAGEDCVRAEDFFALYGDAAHTLALNIKADGLQKLLQELLEKYGTRSYFCFDMSVPDTLGYIESGLDYFVRESEYERAETGERLYDKAAGVWMDGFEGDGWITPERVGRHRKNGKRVCIVSPELHGRDPEGLWRVIREGAMAEDAGLILCTDRPEAAREFFA